MKIVFSLRRDRCAIRVGIFLLVIALVALVIGCVQPVVLSYDLTIASTAGGSVTMPGEGTSTYEEGTVVDLVATPDPGYRFVNWTGDSGVIGNANAASTTIVINDACFIVANFVRQQYDLTSTSTAGGSITVPGEGTITYDEGIVVNLVAEAEEGHRFVGWTGDVSTIEDVNLAQTTIIMDDSHSITANFESKYTPMVAAGGFHTVGLKIDGTVVAAGYNEYGQSDVYSWSDIIQVAAGKWDSLGLKADGTLVSLGWNDYGQLNVGDWTHITEIATSFFHTVGVKSNGTVVAVGENWAKQCDVGSWESIIRVAAGGHHTVGLRANGTVVAVGWNGYGQCDVGEWMDIIQVAAGYTSTVGVKADGTVVAVGRNDYGQLDLGDWTNIVQIVAGERHTVGLKSDGTAVAVGWNRQEQCEVGNWTDIVRIGGSSWHTVGVKSDGTVVAVGENGWEQCNVGDWKLF